MESLLEKKLIVVTGKGGVGKTTIAGAIGLLAARRGARALVLDATGASTQLRRLFGARAADEQEPARLADGLWSFSIDPDRALLEWMRALAGRVPARLLASKASFQYFTAAAPGAKELVCMVDVWRLVDERRYDLLVLDAPATGHALAMLDSPQTFTSIARVGPIASQAEAVGEMLQDSSRTGYLAVAQASEMAVTETLELREALADRLGVALAGVIVNATIQRRFSGEELSRIASLRDGADSSPALQRRVQIAHAAAAAAQSAHARTRFQRSQLARLRRNGLSVARVPFVFQSDLDLRALERIADVLADAL